MDLLNIAERLRIKQSTGRKVNLTPALALSALVILLSSCGGLTFVRKKPADKAYFYRSNIEFTEAVLSSKEKSDLRSKLKSQIEDSVTNVVKDFMFVLHFIKKPPVYDSSYAAQSARNMKAALFHSGYYRSAVSFRADTNRKNQVVVNYIVRLGKPTLITDIQYNLKKADLQQLALASREDALISTGRPVTKAGVISEIGRLVDSFRNNGYYKFSTAELKMRGDTSITALTNVSDDPFEQLEQLALAEQKKDSPQIRLALALNPPTDSSILKPYRIGRIYLLTDFQPGDQLSDTSNITERRTRRFVLRQHEKNIRTGFLNRTIPLRSGDLIRQQDNSYTLTKLAQSGVWRNVNLQVIERKDSAQLADLVFEMSPNFKYSFQAALEASYAASRNNFLAGNLFGLSINFSLLNRNFRNEGIRMTHNVRAGIELNNRSRGSNISTINSNEFSYTNSVVIPQLTWPFNRMNSLRKVINPESYINTSIAYNNRLNLFNLQSLNTGFGFSFSNRKGGKWYWKPISAEFSYLFNESDSFRNILAQNPFLRYSYNTAFALGIGVGSFGYNKAKLSTNKYKTINRESFYKFNLEESGLTLAALPVLNRYKRRFLKTDLEWKYSVNYPKTTLVMRVFAGVGIPVLVGSDTNRTLPFFKQYFGGGSNSMRGWPIRGIGPGGKALTPFTSTATIFNDRTGDMQFESNIEFRYNIAPIIPNTLIMRGAVFVDIGNIWNFRNTGIDGQPDSSRFELKNFYQQLGVSAGTGIRLDFSNLILRFDLGFRFKRPELFYKNAGWKAPDIGFDDFFKKIFTRGPDNEYRRWRYENFNFSIGISYPF